MPAKKPTTLQLPTDEQLFAAIVRAERHLGSERGAELGTIKEHLGLPKSGWSTSKMRPQLERLLAEGAIECFKRRGFVAWNLTIAGRRRLATGLKARRVQLPESPQHRVWRESHAEAAERIEGYRADMGERLQTALALLADTKADAASWQQMAQRLSFASERLASVIYCLREWPEPDDIMRDTNTPWSHKLPSPRRWESA